MSQKRRSSEENTHNRMRNGAGKGVRSIALKKADIKTKHG